MIKILEEGQKTFTRTCNRCGCKFQYDLSDLSGTDYISCPCCHTTLTHVGPNTNKIDLSKFNKLDFPSEIPCKVEVGDGGYNYGTTTGQYINPNTTIYANKLPDDVVDDPYNNVGMQLPDDVCVNTLASI